MKLSRLCAYPALSFAAPYAQIDNLHQPTHPVRSATGTWAGNGIYAARIVGSKGDATETANSRLIRL